jgi:hypothetical protein
VIVYRIEDEAHGGPYNGGRIKTHEYRQWSIDHGYGDGAPHWPAPWEDLKGYPSHVMMAFGMVPDLARWQRLLFGFATKEQAQSWFGRFTGLLAKRGYRVGRYKVDGRKVKSGKYQVAFPREEAQFLGFSDIEDFLSTGVDEKIAA